MKNWLRKGGRTHTMVCQKETVINEVQCLAIQSLYTSASNKEREIKLYVIRQRVSA